MSQISEDLPHFLMYATNPVTLKLEFSNSFVMPFSLDEVYNHISLIQKQTNKKKQGIWHIVS